MKSINLFFACAIALLISACHSGGGYVEQPTSKDESPLYVLSSSEKSSLKTEHEKIAKKTKELLTQIVAKGATIKETPKDNGKSSYYMYKNIKIGKSGTWFIVG